MSCSQYELISKRRTSGHNELQANGISSRYAMQTFDYTDWEPFRFLRLSHNPIQPAITGAPAVKGSGTAV